MDQLLLRTNYRCNELAALNSAHPTKNMTIVTLFGVRKFAKEEPNVHVN